jgi:phage/conjugal plasmid C-4 type zinc finger TraR family protein
MSAGYLGGDVGTEHSMVVAENALHAVRRVMYSSTISATECVDCGDTIPEARRKAMPGVYQCIQCRSLFEKFTPKQKIKMLDRIL